MSAVTPAGQDSFDRRQKRLLAIAWGTTLLPLVAFAYLTWESYQMWRQVRSATEQVQTARDELKELAKKKIELEKANAEQRDSTKHYRDFAGIRIQFYRESDREMVEKALLNLGFKVDSNLGTSTLIDRKPNAMAFGKLVSVQDLRDIAVALVQAGFPLKRIAPATAQPDPKLIQIYASAAADRECGLLSVEEIRAGSTCGPTRK